MKTLKTMVVREDIHIEDYDMRRHCVKTMEREDCVVSLFHFLLGTIAFLPLLVPTHGFCPYFSSLLSFSLTFSIEIPQMPFDRLTKTLKIHN